MIRSRARWIEEGEKPSKYFCNLESRNYLNKTIKKIELEGTGTIYEQTEILDEVKIYYETLYKSADSSLVNINLEEMFLNSNNPKMDTNTSKGLEKDIEEREVLNVLKHMKNNKSPGSDGYIFQVFLE